MKTVIICEKHSARENFAKALGGDSGVYKGMDYVLANLSGHVLEYGKPDEIAKEQYKQEITGFTNLSGLPWSVEKFDFSKRRPKSEHALKQIRFIQTQLKDGRVPVIACDIDPYGEGYLIGYEVLESLGYKGPIYREYHMDESVKGIQKAIDDMLAKNQPVDPFNNEYLMATFRQQGDYLTQVLTRCATVVLQQAGYHLLSHVPFGRLMSVVLTLIGEQNKAIAEFTPSSVFESRYKLGQLVLSNKDIEQFPTKEEWQPGGLPEKAKVKSVGMTPGSTPPPKPLTLSQLSGLVKKYGIKDSVTQKITQQLYNDGILSYPRTEDMFVSPEQFNETLTIFEQVMALINLPTTPFTHKSMRPTHVKEGGAHGALRPGLVLPESIEWLDAKYGHGAGIIYRTVAERYYVMLLEDTTWIRHDYETLTTPVFKGSVRVITQAGGGDKGDDTVVTQLPNLNEMAVLYAHEVKAVKPKAPTSDWLFKQLVKHDVGTEATRLSTLVRLIDNGFVKDGKSLSLSQMGHVGYVMAEGTVIGSIEGTKTMHQMIKSIKKVSDMSEWYDEFEKLLHQDCQTLLSRDVSTIDLKKRDVFTGLWDGKDVTVNRLYGDYRFSDEDAATLLSGGTVTFTFTAKTGKKYKVDGKLADKVTDKGQHYVGIDIAFSMDGFCEGEWKGKTVKFNKTWGTYTFSESECQQLLNGETITINYVKNGNTFPLSGKLTEVVKDGKIYHRFERVQTDRDGYATGVWKGQTVQFKRSFMGYDFSDLEVESLLNGGSITFTGTTRSGNSEYVTGKLAHVTYKGRKYVQFKPDWSK